MEGAFSPINSLPFDCVSHMISLTSPRDACMFSLTSTGFQSVVDTDDTWQHFLPSDCAAVLSRAVDPVMFSSKKDLFVKLCKSPVLIDGGQMSFGLDISSGKKCYMISARELHIAFAEEPQNNYWRWISSPDSRFSYVVEKMEACNLSIHGKINPKELSPETRYGAYLIYKMIENNDLGHPINQIQLRTSVTMNSHVSRNFAYLKDVIEAFRTWQVSLDGATPKERRDGWMEVEIGEFYNETGHGGEVGVSLEEIYGQYWRRGLIVQGIEIRSK